MAGIVKHSSFAIPHDIIVLQYGHLSISTVQELSLESSVRVWRIQAVGSTGQASLLSIPICVNSQLARHSFSDGWFICGSSIFASIRVHSRFFFCAFCAFLRLFTRSLLTSHRRNALAGILGMPF